MIEELGIEIEKLQLKEDDLLIFRVKDQLSNEQIDGVRDVVSKYGKVRALVLCDGMRLEQVPEERMNELGWYRRNG